MDCQWCKGTGYIEGAVWERWECLECKPKPTNVLPDGWVYSNAHHTLMTPGHALLCYCSTMEKAIQIAHLWESEAPRDVVHGDTGCAGSWYEADEQQAFRAKHEAIKA
jgi:hypothetical protein